MFITDVLETSVCIKRKLRKSIKHFIYIYINSKDIALRICLNKFLNLDDEQIGILLEKNDEEENELRE